MSEQYPNQSGSPEQKKPQPLFDDCDNCDKKYQLTRANSAAYHYNKQSECDFILCVCPHCNNRTRIFIGKETMQGVRDNELKVLEDEDYADQNVYQSWLRANGIELPKTYELTTRHEDIIRRFGETVMAIPDDLMIDGFESESGHPYPQKWID